MRDVMRTYLGPGKGVEALTPLLRKCLSPGHRDRPALGCAVPAVLSELPQASAPVKDAFAAEMEAHLTVLDEHLEGRTPRRGRLGTLALSCTAGARSQRARGRWRGARREGREDGVRPRP